MTVNQSTCPWTAQSALWMLCRSISRLAMAKSIPNAFNYVYISLQKWPFSLSQCQKCHCKIVFVLLTKLDLKIRVPLACHSKWWPPLLSFTKQSRPETRPETRTKCPKDRRPKKTENRRTVPTLVHTLLSKMYVGSVGNVTPGLGPKIMYQMEAPQLF